MSPSGVLSRSPRRALLALTALALAGVVSACGSTVAQSARGTGGLSGDGLSAQSGGETGPGGTGVVPGASSGAQSTTGGTTALPGAGSSAPSASSTTGGTGSLGSGVVGVKGNTVEVGFFISKNVEALFKAVGYENLSPGNQEHQVNTIVAYINKRGGLGGKKIVPVFGIWDATAGNTVSQREAACAKWTEDHHVVAMLAESFDSFTGCSNRHKIPLMFGNPMPITMEELRRTPMMATATTPSDERFHPAWVNALDEAGYFKGKGVAPMKLGVLYLDTPPQGRSYKNNLVPALAAHKITVTQAVGLPATTVQESIAAIQSAVLKFHAAGVTNIMVMDTGGITLLFSAQAEAQGYRPRYGLHSYAHPSALETQAPKDQLTDAVGAGWFSTNDVGPRYRPKDTAGGKLCLSIMTAAGEDMATTSTRESAFIYCDMAFTLWQAANRASVLSSLGIMGGLNTLGPEHTVGSSFLSDFRGHRDGPSEARPFAFGTACGCFTYTDSPAQRF